ncbi:MAG: NAD synthetase, partial [Methanosaeta sp. SDB]
ICEDAWNDPALWPTRLYSFDPIEALAKMGATLLINISASPFHLGKERVRFGLIRRHAKKYGIPFVYVNQVGGNDELIFDGSSLCIDGNGNAIKVFPSFEEAVGIADLTARGRPDMQPANGEIESLRKALVLGIRDYARKCGFSKAVVGLSGGIDSAVTCCLAAEALGGLNVLGVSMPSPYTSTESRDLSIKLAKNLGIEFEEIFISEIYRSYVESLKAHLGLPVDEVDVTLENVQARIRGNVLMAISNRFGHLVLSTGNKSEIAVGYCTLYGDLSGGLAAISDVPKTMVYRLAEQINRDGEIIPTEIIKRPPSAELKPDQKDQDTLPTYDVLDTILHQYVEEGLSAGDIIDLGFDADTVNWVARAVKRNEYKRKQVPPGLKVTTKAFGTGRRMPIAARYED